MGKALADVKNGDCGENRGEHGDKKKFELKQGCQNRCFNWQRN